MIAAGRRAGHEIDQGLAVAAPDAAAQKPHSSLVAAGSASTANFST